MALIRLIHRVTGCDDVAASIRLSHRLLAQDREGLVVDNLPLDQQSVPTVCGEGIEDIADDDVGRRSLDCTHRAADQVVGIEALLPTWRLSLVGGDREDGDGGIPSASASCTALTSVSML